MILLLRWIKKLSTSLFRRMLVWNKEEKDTSIYRCWIRARFLFWFWIVYYNILQWHILIIPLSQLTHPYIFYQTKTPFWRTSVLLTGHHAESVVTLLFSLTHVTCVLLYNTVVTRYRTSVTYGTLCHASSHLVTWFERVFFTLMRFLPCFSGSDGSSSKLAGFHADLKNIVPARLFVCIATIHKRFICGRFYLRAKAG